jgi:hypothetical protein
VPGTYRSAAALTLTETLKLDAKDDLNPESTFIIGAALTTAGAFVVEIINPANNTAAIVEMERHCRHHSRRGFRHDG